MKRSFNVIGAAALSLAMIASVIPVNSENAEAAADYVYDESYTVGWGIVGQDEKGQNIYKAVAYRGGSDYQTFEEAGLPVYDKRGDDPFKSELEQAWDAEKLTLAKPVKYTDEDGKVYNVESALTGFDFIADPTAIDNSDVDGKLYVYGTTEGFSYNGDTMADNSYDNHSLSILSSSDMVNWTDEGFMDSRNLTNLPDSKKAEHVAGRYTSGHSWAPSGLKYDYDHDGVYSYYLFFTDGGSTGYVIGDSPCGPWRDPEGKAIFRGFDPAVLVDEYGDAYVYYGGLQRDAARGSKVLFDEESGKVVPDGNPVNLGNYCHFEDNEINYFNGKYYYSYCTDFTNDASQGKPQTLTGMGTIAVYVSNDPLHFGFDPTQVEKGKEFEAYTDENGIYRHFLGTVLDNPSVIYGQSYNNHHHMQEFRGKKYIFYHSTEFNNALHHSTHQYRNLHVDEITVDPETDEIDGVGEPIKNSNKHMIATYEGADQIGSYNLYNNIVIDNNGNEVITDKKTINATTTSYSAGVKSTRSDAMVEAVNSGNVTVSGGSPMVLDSIETGDWTKLQGVNFGNGAVKFEAKLASTTKNGAIELFIDDPTKASNMIAKVDVKDTGDIDTYDTVLTTDIKPVVGVHDLYFVFRGSDYRVAAWSFDESEVPLIKEATPEPSTTPQPAPASAAPSAAPAATSAPAAPSAAPANDVKTTAKKAGIKITGKRVVKVGKSITLRAKLSNVKGTVKWSVNKKKIATISSKGKLKGKKPGKVKVTAKVKKVKATVTITVKKR